MYCNSCTEELKPWNLVLLSIQTKILLKRMVPVLLTWQLVRVLNFWTKRDGSVWLIKYNRKLFSKYEMKSPVFWGIMPCCPLKINRHFQRNMLPSFTFRVKALLWDFQIQQNRTLSLSHTQPFHYIYEHILLCFMKRYIHQGNFCVLYK
jgi:hypothetical protein